MRSIAVQLRKRKKQCIALFFLLIILCPCGILPVSAAYTKTEATAIYQKTKIDSMQSKGFASVEYQSGQLIVRGGDDTQVVIGGLVKIMTLLLFLAIGIWLIKTET